MKVQFTVTASIDVDLETVELPEDDPDASAIGVAWDKMRADPEVFKEALFEGSWSDPYEFDAPVTCKLQTLAEDGALLGVIGLSDVQVASLLGGDVVAVRGEVPHAAAVRAAAALAEHLPEALLLVFPPGADVVTLERIGVEAEGT